MEFFKKMNPIWEKSFFGISLLEMLFFVLFLLVIEVFFRIFLPIFLRKWEKITQKTESTFDDFAREFIQKMGIPLRILFILGGARLLLPLPPVGERFLEISAFVFVLFFGVLFLFRMIDFFTEVLIKKMGIPDFPVFAKIIKIFVASFAFVLALSHFGINVTSLLAGLGIGGIAIALAAQNVLRDLFASVSISLDRPFAVGDFVTFGDIAGNVSHIGIKSTRIKTLQGEEVSVPNTKITETDIHNFSRLERRRINFSIGVTYNTPITKIKRAKEIIQKSIEKQENVDFGRCFFWKFAESSLNFDIVYFVNSGDQEVYLALQEKIGLDILEKFTEEKIEFAFPTQTIFVQKES